MPLISHSDPHNLQLHEHTGYVSDALRLIVASHRGSIFRDEAFDHLCQMAALFHDTGKAIQAFQEYITCKPTPQDWSGDYREKVHALASSVIAGLFLHQQKYPAPLILAATYAIRGHHTRLPTRIDNDRSFSEQRGMEILKRQLSSIDLEALSQEIGGDLRGVFKDTPIEEIHKFRFLLDRQWDKMPKDEAKLWKFRIKTQLAYSCLLEADRAQLIMGDLEKFSLPVVGEVLTQGKITRYLEDRPDSKLNEQRAGAGELVLKNLKTIKACGEPRRIYTLSLPTGLGKTAIAARWAADWLESEPDRPRKIIVVQPFLSITRQTEDVYKQILGEEVSGATLMPYHSISERRYADTELTGKNQEGFYLDTWKSGIIITTYDQLLLAMFSQKAKHQMRFHNLCDALIILDEFQSVPCMLWDPLAKMLDQITEMGDSRVLAMSATLPKFFESSERLLSLADRDQYRRSFKRYEIFLDHRNDQTVGEFCDTLPVEDWLTYKKRVMLVVNTRRTARKIRDYLKGKMADKDRSTVVYLSTDITSEERQNCIERIQQGQPCIVVSTQCIEAGVDIDMDVIYSDFAPWDSLIQRAGRLNRHWRKAGRCPMYVVSLKDEAGRRDADKIYDAIHLTVTREVALSAGSSIKEEDLPMLCDGFFRRLQQKKNTGTALTSAFLRWEGDIGVRTVLRGDRSGREVQFLVTDSHPDLVPQIEKALEIENKFDRRRALRDLAPTLAGLTISRYGTECPDPDAISDWVGPFRVLKAGQYEPYKGLIDDEV